MNLNHSQLLLNKLKFSKKRPAKLIKVINEMFFYKVFKTRSLLTSIYCIISQCIFENVQSSKKIQRETNTKANSSTKSQTDISRKTIRAVYIL